MDPTLDSEPTVVRGTHTPLDADLVVTYGGTTVPLQVSPAFAYDLDGPRLTLHHLPAAAGPIDRARRR